MGHLTLLGMMLIAGLAGNRLRLTQGDATVEAKGPTAAGIPITYSTGRITRSITVPHMVVAVRVARRWLTETPTTARGRFV